MHTFARIALVAMLGAAWLSPAAAEPLTIPGTGSAEVILGELAAGFNALYPEHRVSVPRSTGSDNAVRALESDEAVLGRVSKPLKEADAKKGLRYLPFAKDAVVFAAGSAVRVTGVSTEQLSDIFTGKATNWREVGGDPAPIRVLVREKSDSKFGVIQQHVPSFRNIAFSPQAKLLHHSYEMIAMLDKFDMSIGWVTRSTLHGSRTPLKTLALDNVAPTVDNIASGKYRLVMDFALIYREQRLTEGARRFIDYIYSDGGRAILEKNGLLPLTRPRA